MGSPEDVFSIIGKDIPWETIRGEACRVKRFLPFGQVVNGRVKGPGLTSMPYAVLAVESPKLTQEARLPVVHKEDFRNLWDVFEQRGVSTEEEVLVIYEPFVRRGVIRFLSRVVPSLHIYIFPARHLEEAHDPNFKPDAPRTWWEPIAVWHPGHWGF